MHFGSGGRFSCSVLCGLGMSTRRRLVFLVSLTGLWVIRNGVYCRLSKLHRSSVCGLFLHWWFFLQRGSHLSWGSGLRKVKGMLGRFCLPRIATGFRRWCGLVCVGFVYARPRRDGGRIAQLTRGQRLRSFSLIVIRDAAVSSHIGRILAH